MTADLLERLRAAVDPVTAPAPVIPPAVDGRRNAAVLLLADPATEGLPVLFMRRTRLVRSHRGQIALPGGGVEPGDAGPVGTALREAHEELGVARDRVEVLGVLRPVTTASSERHLIPVVALERSPVHPVPDGFEVADWFRIPLAELMVAPVVARHIPGGGRDGFVRFYEVGGRVIWGATAAILHDLLGRLGRTD